MDDGPASRSGQSEGDFQQAIDRFTDAITLNRNDHVLFSNRSYAYAKMGRFTEALEDAKRCQELKPDWPKAYYRLGVALLGLGQFEDAIVAFAEGLAADPKQTPMLNGLTETMLKSPFRGSFQPKLEKFEGFKLDKNPFIIASVVGQELQSANRLDAAMRVLEAARNISTDSLKLEASLMQALGRVHWALGNKEKALEYMERDLKINETLQDSAGQCRALDNLGTAFFTMGRHKDAVQRHSLQCSLAYSMQEPLEIISALTHLGNAFEKVGDHMQALKTYKESLRFAREQGNAALIFQAYVNLANAYISSGEVDKAMTIHHHHLTYAKETKNKMEEAEAYALLGHACFIKSNFEQSIMFYQQLLSVAVQTSDMKLKSRAYAGMGQANRSMGNLFHAQSCHEQQLKLCKDIGDELGQIDSLTQLGHIHKSSGKLSAAMQQYNESLELAQKVKNREAEGKAYANLGSCYVSLGNFREAVNFYQKELDISHEVGNVASESSTLGHLGMAYHALENKDLALQHLRKSLELAQQVQQKDIECQALSNLGTCYTTSKNYEEAVPYLEKALRLAQELKEHDIECKACHSLGVCHEALGNYQQAIQYYQHDFLVAKETQDREGMTKACEKLIRANNEVGDKEQADVYQKKLLNIAEEIQNTSGKCSFWNQVADDLLQSGDYDRAIEFYQNLLKEAKKEQHQSFEGFAYCGLGNAYLARGDYEHALSYHQRDLQVRKMAGDLMGESSAYANMGAAQNSLGLHQQAVDCYERSLAIAKQLNNPTLITKAYGCLGIVLRNMKNFHKALTNHKLQLQTALLLKESILEQANAYANLGDSYEAVGDYLQSVHNHEQNLLLSRKIQNFSLEMRALSSLGRANRGLGNLTMAKAFFEEQLKLAISQGDEYTEAECYADIGGIHMLLGDYHSALEAYTRQLQLARSLEDVFSEALAACGMGEVHARLGNNKEALDYHKLDLQICSSNQILEGKTRAYGNLADTYESIGEYRMAVGFREKQLTTAEEIDDNFTKALAFTGLGKIYIKLGDYHNALNILKQALSLVGEQNAFNTDQQTQAEIEVEAKIRFFLGQAHYYLEHFEHALSSLQKALPLFEHMRQNVGSYDHGTKHTLELHAVLFQTLVNTLVRLKKVEEALEIAELERNRAITDALLERGVGRQSLKDCGLLRQYVPQTSWIQDAVNAIHCPVLYFAIALNHVFVWLIHPHSGIVQFQRLDMTDFGVPGSDTSSVFSENSSSYTQPLTDTVVSLREGLGVEHRRQSLKSLTSAISDDLDSGEDPEVTSLNSSYSRSTEGAGTNHKGPRPLNLQPVHELYDLLIRPLECALPQPKAPGNVAGQLIIIPDKDLYLVPFGLLKGESTAEHLYERFHLQFYPSLQSLVPRTPKRTMTPNSRSFSSFSGLPASELQNRFTASISPSTSPTASSRVLPSTSSHLVVGNPAVPISASECEWQPLTGSEKEVHLISDILGSKPLIGKAASKERVVQKMTDALSIHFATNISWSTSHIVLAPSKDAPGTPADNERGLGEGSSSGRREEADGAVNSMPDPGEYLLSVTEILNMKIPAKLVVLSGCHRREVTRLTSKSLMCMVQALLASGVECVLVPLWPATFQASRLMMNAFYSSLAIGSKTSRALSYAMQVVHENGKYSHPSNWAGYFLIGRDIVLMDRGKDLAKSIRCILQSPLDYLIAALKTLQAIIVSALKHLTQLQNGAVEPKYTARQSVESKIGTVHGWEELLSCTGFHFISQLKKDVPATIVFPEHDDSGLLRRCQKHLEALLGLPPPCLKTLASLSKNPSIARCLLATLRAARATADAPDNSPSTIQVDIEREAWDTTGCLEFFRRLQFEAVPSTLSAQWVTLSAQIGKVDNRMLHFASTSVIAVFGPEELMEAAPRKVQQMKTSGTL